MVAKKKAAPSPASTEEAKLADPLGRPAASEETLIEAAKPAKAAGLVRMKRGDKFADVHPAEVENYRAGGYEEA